MGHPYSDLKNLRPRHREIIRLAFLGWSSVKIAAVIGISPVAVRCILLSPLAKAEIDRMTEEANSGVVNVPLRVRLHNELEGATEEAARLNRSIMNNVGVDVRVRYKIAKHFMDRILFDVQDGQETSYRELLRKMDEVQKTLDSGRVLVVEGEAERVDDDAPVSVGSIEKK